MNKKLEKIGKKNWSLWHLDGGYVIIGIGIMVSSRRRLYQCMVVNSYGNYIWIWILVVRTGEKKKKKKKNKKIIKTCQSLWNTVLNYFGVCDGIIPRWITSEVFRICLIEISKGYSISKVSRYIFLSDRWYSIYISQGPLKAIAHCAN